MVFDKTKPINGTLADADVIRANMLALATHHRGGTAPTNPELGYIWLDTSIVDNWVLKVYSQNGANPADWVILFSHIESIPAIKALVDASNTVLSLGTIADGKFLKRDGASIIGADVSGGGSAEPWYATPLKGSIALSDPGGGGAPPAGTIAEVSQISPRAVIGGAEFDSQLVYVYCRIKIADIVTESAITLDDPNNALTTFEYFDHPFILGYRGVRAIASGNSGVAVATWSWNDVPFEITISVG